MDSYWILILAELDTPQGNFQAMSRNYDHLAWDFSDDVSVHPNGTIFWRTLDPAGVLIKYPCGTKRFINNSWYE